jgi:hypothetical protein
MCVQKHKQNHANVVQKQIHANVVYASLGVHIVCVYIYIGDKPAESRPLECIASISHELKFFAAAPIFLPLL